MTLDSRQSDWREIAPGVYDDGEGGLHLDVREVIADRGYEPTPENIRRTLDAWEKLLREEGLEFEVIE